MAQAIVVLIVIGSLSIGAMLLIISLSGKFLAGIAAGFIMFGVTTAMTMDMSSGETKRGLTEIFNKIVKK